MAFDIALDKETGDLVMAPNGDLAGVSGEDDINQRIFIRLRIVRESWALDPTGGTLGSRLRQVTTMSTADAAAQIPIYVREALLPMSDINVTDVIVNYAENGRFEVVVNYNVVDDPDDTNQSTTFPLTA